MIRTYLQLEVAEGAAADLVELFKREQVLEAATTQPGCRSAELTLSDDGSTAVVTAEWESPKAYERWTQRGDRGYLAERLNQYLAHPIGKESTGALHHIVHTGINSRHSLQDADEEDT